ncbi:MAG: hypothetical protein GXP32_06200 [Kiritimatiellaeota bacterium]|nr:hypothetical protein [Kiritimatiellota bacterium]
MFLEALGGYGIVGLIYDMLDSLVETTRSLINNAFFLFQSGEKAIGLFLRWATNTAFGRILNPGTCAFRGTL